MYWVDKNDEHVHPGLFTQIDVENFNNPWVPNPRIVNLLGFDMSYSAFIKQTKKTIELLMLSEKQPVIIWPYHGINYELGRSVPFPLGELLFVHSIARDTTPYIISKGEENNIESYGAFAPDIIEEEKYNEPVLYDITDYDAIIIAGEASTHCVKYTLLQLIDFILNNRSNGHVAKIYVAKDCMSPVPGFEDDIDSIIEQHEFVFGVNLFVDGPIDVELLPEM
jgi:nicotinamidase-related amidase